MVRTSAKLGSPPEPVEPDVSLFDEVTFEVVDADEVLGFDELVDVVCPEVVVTEEVLADEVTTGVVPLELLAVTVVASVDVELDIGETAGSSSSGPEQLHTMRQENKPCARRGATRCFMSSSPYGCSSLASTEPGWQRPIPYEDAERWRSFDTARPSH